MSFLTTNDFWKPRTFYRSQPAPFITKFLVSSIFSDNVIYGLNPIDSITMTVTDGIAHPINQKVSFKLVETEIEYTLLVKAESETTFNTMVSTSKGTALKPIIFG